METGRVVMKKWGRGRIVMLSMMSAAALGLGIANEKRRHLIILHNEAIAQKTAQDLKDLQRLGFLDRDMAVQSTYERLQAARTGIDMAQRKWWMISIKTDEKKSQQVTLKRLLSLNRKILKSYRQDLNDMRTFGFRENDPRVVFSRNKIARTIVELAHLTREHDYRGSNQGSITPDQMKLVQQTMMLNEDAIKGYKAEIEGHFQQGIDPQSQKIREIRSKIAVKLDENNHLERKMNR